MLSARKLISEEKIQEFSAEQDFKVEKEDLDKISREKKYFYAQLLHSQRYKSKDLEEATGIAVSEIARKKTKKRNERPENSAPKT